MARAHAHSGRSEPRCRANAGGTARPAGPPVPGPGEPRGLCATCAGPLAAAAHGAGGNGLHRVAARAGAPMSDLTVDGVELTTLPEQRLTQAMAQSGAVFHDLVVTLSNHGATTQFVPTEVTRIRYDPQSRVLQLHSGD